MDKLSWSEPVSLLLKLGEPEGYEVEDWSRSVVEGITPAHVPELIRLLEDPEFNDEALDDERIFAPIHAARAIGYFRAEEAVDALIRSIDRRTRWQDYDGWSAEEYPQILQRIGPTAIPKMGDAVADSTLAPFVRAVLAEFMAQIAIDHSSTRAAVITTLIDAAEHFNDNPPEVNNGIVAGLLELKALESVPLLRRIFRAQAIDEWVIGDWASVRRDLKLERLPDDPPSRGSGKVELLDNPHLIVDPALEYLDPEEIAEPQAESPLVKRSGKWHRKQAKKRKSQTRRC